MHTFPDEWLTCDLYPLSLVLLSDTLLQLAKTYIYTHMAIIGLGLSLLTVYFALVLVILRHVAEWYSRQKGSSSEITSVSAHRKGIQRPAQSYQSLGDCQR